MPRHEMSKAFDGMPEIQYVCEEERRAWQLSNEGWIKVEFMDGLMRAIEYEPPYGETLLERFRRWLGL
jgi:hypothetical protein